MMGSWRAPMLCNDLPVNFLESPQRGTNCMKKWPFGIAGKLSA
jgi:hypothetical protein